MKLAPLSYRPEIDGLRAVAVLLVVVFHAFPGLLPGGYIGVDIFFVISGYLITRIIETSRSKGDFSLAGFYKRRVRRIFPALLVVIALTVALSNVLFGDAEYKATLTHALLAAAFSLNFQLIGQEDYFASVNAFKPLLHLWSLCVEEQFYLVMPWMFFLANTVSRRAPRAKAIIVWTVAMASLVACIWLTQHSHAIAYYMPFTRAWEFLIGSLVFIHSGTAMSGQPSASPSANQDSQFRRQIKAAAFWACLAGILACALLFRDELAFPGWIALGPTLAAAGIIWLQSDEAKRDSACQGRARIHPASSILANPVLVHLGKLSFPLYLLHWPILVFARYVAQSDALSTTATLACCITAIAGADLIYRALERPIANLSFDDAFKPLMSAAAGLLVACMVLLSTSFRMQPFDRSLARFQGPIALSTSWAKEAKVGRCFITEFDKHELHPDCIQAGQRSIFLWGDSHGAALATGFARFSETHRIAFSQQTQALCPPIMGATHTPTGDRCARQNLAALRRLTEVQPHLVVLHAYWSNALYNLSEQQLVSGLQATIDRIRAASPGSQVMLVGPVPLWRGGIARAALRSVLWEHQSLSAKPVARDSMLAEAERLDKVLQAIGNQAGVAYWSPLAHLCQAGQCMLAIGPGQQNVGAIDYGHVTPAVARFLVSLMPLDGREWVTAPAPSM